MNRLMAFGCAAVAFAGLAAFGETYTWKGGEGAFDAAENWTTSGGGHAVPSGTTSDLAFPSGGTVTGVGSLTVNNISLGAAVDLQFGTGGGTFTVNGVISGSGSLKSTGNAAANCYMYLYGNNTFTGGYTNYGGQTVVGHNNCLGTGAATFLGNAKPAQCLFAAKGVTLPNNLTIGEATGSSWGGPINANYQNLTFAGTVHYKAKCVASGDACVRFSTGTTTHKGNVYLDDSIPTGFVCDGNVVFEKAIVSETGKTFGFQINGGTPTATLKGSGNAIDHLKWANSDGTFVFGAKNVFATPKSILTGGGTATTGNFFVDLGGFDQEVESVYDTQGKLVDSAVRRVYSATPALISMRASANRAFRGSFNDKVTLCWAPTGNYAYTIQGVESTTSAGLIVSNGTVNVTDGASFPNVTSIAVSPGATLSFASGCICNTALKTLVLGSTAGTSFAVADGGTFTVDELFVVDSSGNRTKQPGNATYTSTEISALGEGITVRTTAGIATYVGPNGGKWSVADNWEDKAVPSANAQIRIGSGVSSVEVDVEASIVEFTAPADTVLTLTGDGKLVLAADKVVFENSKDLLVQCEISGEGQLVSRGAGALKLEHANTYTGGTLRDTDVVSGSSFAGAIYVGHNQALGTGRVEMNAHAGLNIYSSVTEVANDISWNSTYASNPAFYSHLIVNGKTSFTGTLDFSKTRCARAVSYGSSVTYNNVVLETTTSLGWDHILIAKMNKHIFTGKVSGKGVIGCDTYSDWAFSSPSNDLYAVYFYGKTTGSLLESLVKDTFLDTTRIIFRTGTGATAQSWNLHGFDQTVECAYDSVDGAPAAHVHYVTTDDAKPTRLTMKGLADHTFAGAYRGPLTVCWNPVGASTLTLDGAAHTTSGALVVSNGTVNVTGGASFADLTGLEVAPNATLSFAAGTSVKANLAKLVLAETATLQFADETELLVDEFWTVDAAGNMTQQDPDKSFTSAQFSALKGVKVTTAHRELPSVPVTWTAGGADTALTTDANWSAKPDLSSARTVATFAQAGSVATATESATLKGIVFRDVAPFELVGPGSVALYEAGITTETPGAGSGTYTISAPLAISSSSVWNVADGTTLDIRGAVTGFESAPGAATVVVTGKGTVDWHEAAGSTCAADFIISNKAVNVYGKAFGSGANGTLTLTDYPEGSTHVYFRGATVDQAIELGPQASENVRWGSRDFFSCVANTTNVFNGPIHIRDNYVRFQCPGGACCLFAGGMTNDSYWYPVPLGAGTYVITNTPVKVGCWWSDTTGHTVIAVPGNEMSIHLGNTSASGVTSSIRLDVDNAAKRCKELYLSSEARFDLNGHDFVADALTTGNANSTPEVTSLTPATLSVTNFTGNPTSHPVRFTGAASFVKGGNTTFTLTGVSTSTGSVEVIGGALAFGENASWRGASRVNVAKWTRMELSNPKTFGRKTDLYLNSGTADNVGFKLMKQGRFVVHDLYIDGVKQATGTWGAEGSKDETGKSPDHVHPLFLGEGVLFARGDSGLTVIIR